MSSKQIDIQIDNLILNGIDPGHRARIVEAMRRELERLVAAGGVPPGWTGGEAAPRVPPIEVGAATSPARIGARVARALYRGVKS